MGPVCIETNGGSSWVDRFIYLRACVKEVCVKTWCGICLALLFLALSSPLIAQETPGTITTVPGIGYARPGGNRFGWEDGSGGMTIDGRGNLFICSGYMVYRKSPDGTTKVV